MGLISKIAPFFGRQARLLNINTYTDGLESLYLQGGHYFAYALVILVPTGAIMMWVRALVLRLWALLKTLTA